MRRVNCSTCGVKIEKTPWADGKYTSCNSFRSFLASWAKRLSWKETASRFHTSWDIVADSVKWVVEYGLKHRVLKGVQAIGVDEVAYSKGHHYMTLVYQIEKDNKRLIAVIKNRDTQSFDSFFEKMGPEWCSNIKVVCSDMWRAYLNVIAQRLPQALNVLDRFHVVKKLNEAVNKVRVEEAKNLKNNHYEPVMKGAKYCFLKRPENLTDKQSTKLNDILHYDLKTVRAYCHKEAFDTFWKYTSPYWARWFLKKWCFRVMRSRLEPMKKFVKTLRNHEDLLMNYFRANKEYSSGIVEGLNLRINLCMRKAYGYRSFKLLQVSLYHTLGDLPEPKSTHKFF